MIAKSPPTASRTRRTVLIPSCTLSGLIRSLAARNPCSCAASTASVLASGGSEAAVDAYAGSRLTALPKNTETGWPVTLPTMSHRAASSGQ